MVKDTEITAVILPLTEYHPSRGAHYCRSVVCRQYQMYRDTRCIFNRALNSEHTATSTETREQYGGSGVRVDTAQKQPEIITCMEVLIDGAYHFLCDHCWKKRPVTGCCDTPPYHRVHLRPPASYFQVQQMRGWAVRVFSKLSTIFSTNLD